MVSEGYPQTPGNPDASGLHTPIFMNPPRLEKVDLNYQPPGSAARTSIADDP